VPIGLSYDASGLRIDEEATWSGLGWNLTCGGFIVREMKGGRDEYHAGGYARPQVNPWIWNSAAFDDITSTTSFVSDADADQVVFKMRSGLDTQPDEFHFTINGRSGKFYLDQNGNPVTDDKVSITYTLEPCSLSQTAFCNLLTFTITDEFGIKYHFSARELQTVSSYYSGAGIYPVSESGEYVEWYMTSMETPDGLAKINFEYDLSKNSPGSTWELRTSSEQFKVLNKAGTIYKIYDYNISQIRQGMVFLSRIYTDNEEILFDKLPYNGRLQAKLDKIRIRNRITEQEWHYKFFTSDFGVSKFLLDAISKVSGSVQETFYQFSYNPESVAVSYGDCQEFSYAGLDHWGYHNGAKVYQSRIPSGETMFNYQNLPVVPISNRSVNSSAAKAGSLERITLPTKGSINFEYESNDYGYVGSTALPFTKSAGGLRLKKIAYNDGDEETIDVVKIFNYQSEENPLLSSGVLPFEPIYNFNYASDDYSCNQWVNNPILPIDIGYSQVTEINNDGSKLVYRFNSSKEYPPTSDPGDLAITYHSHGAGIWTQLYKRNTDLSNPYFKSDFVNNHMRGTLKDKLVYDNQGNKVQETHYDYTSWIVGKLLSIKQSYFELITPSNTNYPGVPNSVSFLLKHYINLGRYELSKETVKTYQSGDYVNPLVRSTEYVYNSNYFVKETSELGSDGKEVKNFFSYPTDYNNSTMNGVIGTLRSINAIALPIEVLKTVDGKITEGTVYEYDNYARPTKVYSLETVGDIIHSSSLLNPNAHISLPSHYRQKYSYVYNSGRLVEIDTYGYKSSLLWGYSNSKVIAKTENSGYNNSFHTSFEETGSLDALAKSGIKSVSTPFILNPPNWYVGGQENILSYWFWDGKWNFKEVNFNGGNLTISDGTKIDDLRIYPKGSLMTTYTYDLIAGVNNISDWSGLNQRFEFDNFGRLIKTRDDQFNLLITFKYSYKQ
jgi:hypothetical protein